jgi:hypothetical protein
MASFPIASAPIPGWDIRPTPFALTLAGISKWEKLPLDSGETAGERGVGVQSTKDTDWIDIRQLLI